MSTLIATYLPIAISVIGALAFVVSVITEVTKGLPGLSKIPTDAQVFVLSITLTVVTLMAYASYAAIALYWYMIIGAVIAGIFVAFVAMYGWDKLSALYTRFKQI
jgi:hypothetical protein